MLAGATSKGFGKAEVICTCEKEPKSGSIMPGGICIIPGIPPGRNIPGIPIPMWGPKPSMAERCCALHTDSLIYCFRMLSKRLCCPSERARTQLSNLVVMNCQNVKTPLLALVLAAC